MMKAKEKENETKNRMNCRNYCCHPCPLQRDVGCAYLGSHIGARVGSTWYLRTYKKIIHYQLHGILDELNFACPKPNKNQE
jgi:hypothetical protein